MSLKFCSLEAMGALFMLHRSRANDTGAHYTQPTTSIVPLKSIKLFCSLFLDDDDASDSILVVIGHFLSVFFSNCLFFVVFVFVVFLFRFFVFIVVCFGCLVVVLVVVLVLVVLVVLVVLLFVCLFVCLFLFLVGFQSSFKFQ